MVMRERDRFQSHFTKSPYLVDYMVQMLHPRSGDLVLEPAAGHGSFVDAVLRTTPDVRIQAYELNEDSFLELKRKYEGDSRISLSHANTLVEGTFGPRARSQDVYDRIVANPPYGAWLEYSERDRLKLLYPGIYAKETYALFLALGVRLLKPGGRLVFITPDTFLNLHRHSYLRRVLLTQCLIREIAIFPSNFFLGIGFAYAKLSIITLEKSSSESESLENGIVIRSNFSAPSMLMDEATFDGTTMVRSQRDVYAAPDHAFLLNDNIAVSRLLESSSPKLGELASCVTGFYSGDDQRFLRHNSPDARNARKYGRISSDLVTLSPTDKEKMIGISGRRCFVPIRKGGSAEYVATEHWFMDWSQNAVSHYKTDKKARYQNSQYYFRNGIGVPMVSSRRVKAALIQQELFDQSIVGIFPHDVDLVPYLLCLLNSSTGNVLVRTVNPSANNSANYLKKIPVVMPSSDLLLSIRHDVRGIIAQLQVDPSFDVAPFRVRMDDLFRTIYGF